MGWTEGSTKRHTDRLVFTLVSRDDYDTFQCSASL